MTRHHGLRLSLTDSLPRFLPRSRAAAPEPAAPGARGCRGGMGCQARPQVTRRVVLAGEAGDWVLLPTRRLRGQGRLLPPAALVVRDEVGAELPYKVLLIAVHDALMVAALPFGWRLVGSSSSSSSNAGAQSRGLLLFAAAAGSLVAGSHLLNSADIVRELLRSSVIATTPQDVLAAIVGGGFPAANACQASISTDVVGTTATVMLYIVASAAGVTQEAVLHSDSSSGGSSKSGRGVVYALCFCAAVPVLSLCGACCALVLLREWAAGAPPQEAAAAPIAVKEKIR